MKLRIALGALALSLAAANSGFAARTILYYENECCRNITEGEFAILYAQGMKLREPAQGWTIQSAAAAMSSLGHQPEGGWFLSRFLSEGVMSRLLNNSAFYRKPFSDSVFQTSQTLVTVSKARSVFPPDEGITQGEFAILLAQALNIPSPRNGWTGEAACVALASRSVPNRPAGGWRPGDVLREADMMQTLATTPYRPVPIDPAKMVTTLQAYSLLFGKSEIATEGDFGVFFVNAIGAAPPAGGWTGRSALEYIRREFNVENGYGWNPAVPLCTEVLDSALRQILKKVRAGAKPSEKGWEADGMMSGLGGLLLNTPSHSLRRVASPFIHGPWVEEGQTQPARQDNSIDRRVESLISDIRGGGFISSDPCAIVPLDVRVPPPPPPRPPASPSVPPH